MLLMLLAIPPAHAVDVLVYGDTTTVNSDLQSKLIREGVFDAVDVAYSGSVTASAALFAEYDAIYLYNGNDIYAFDQYAWGDAAAAHLDAGGGVVVGTSLFASMDNGWGMAGDFHDKGYEAWIPLDNPAAGPSSQTLIVDAPDHPILDDISFVDSGTGPNIITLVGAADDATLVGHWPYLDMAAVIAADRGGGRLAMINLHPGSSDLYDTYWDADGEVPKLMANALLWTSGAIGESGQGDSGEPGDDTGPSSSGEDEGCTGCSTPATAAVLPAFAALLFLRRRDPNSEVRNPKSG